MKEYIEIWDWESATPSGKSIERNEAHEKGIAHEGVHLWICRRGKQGGELIFQHRSPDKINYPDCLDISVAGHVPFGMKENKIQKEAGEELGITPPDDVLVALGLFRYEENEEKYFHREFQRIYVMMDNRPLSQYSFVDGEVTGIFSVPVDYLKKLFLEDAVFECSGFDGKLEITRKISKKDFHPLLFSRVMAPYMKVILQAVEQIIKGKEVTVRMPQL